MSSRQQFAAPSRARRAVQALAGTDSLGNWAALAVLLACWSLEARLATEAPRTTLARAAKPLRAAAHRGAAQGYYLAGYHAERWRAAALAAATSR
jgi:hypothetical protein